MNIFEEKGLRPVPALCRTDIPALRSPAAGSGQVAIDIITPTLNAEAWISAAIASVRVSSLPGVRHVVVDGGSHDATLPICTAAGIEIIRADGKDSHEAMNIGLRATSAPIVGFLNADDAYVDDPLPVAVDRLAAPDLSAVVFDSAVCDAEGRLLARLRHASGRDRLVELMYGTPGFNGYFFRREALVRLGGFEAGYRIAADRDVLLRMEAAGLASAFERRVGYAYRRHAGSRTLDSAARLGDAILADHIRIARDLGAQAALGPDLRARLAAWEAHETVVANRRAGMSLIVALVAAGPRAATLAVSARFGAKAARARLAASPP